MLGFLLGEFSLVGFFVDIFVDVQVIGKAIAVMREIECPSLGQMTVRTTIIQ